MTSVHRGDVRWSTRSSLVWPNKDLPLRASGLTSYEWVQPTDRRLTKPLKTAAIYPGDFGPQSNVLVVGDGFDALESLQRTQVFDVDKVRLVYIDPPSTQARASTSTATTWPVRCGCQCCATASPR